MRYARGWLYVSLSKRTAAILLAHFPINLGLWLSVWLP